MDPSIWLAALMHNIVSMGSWPHTGCRKACSVRHSELPLVSYVVISTCMMHSVPRASDLRVGADRTPDGLARYGRPRPTQQQEVHAP